jgi:hypothetical protein
MLSKLVPLQYPNCLVTPFDIKSRRGIIGIAAAAIMASTQRTKIKTIASAAPKEALGSSTKCVRDMENHSNPIAAKRKKQIIQNKRLSPFSKLIRSVRSRANESPRDSTIAKPKTTPMKSLTRS